MVLHDVPPRRPRQVRQKWKKVGLQDDRKSHELFSGPFFSEKKIDGTLERAKIDCLRNRAKKRLASDLRKKRQVRRSGDARRELRDHARRDNNRLYRQQYDDDGDDDCDNPDRDRGGCRLGQAERERNNKKKAIAWRQTSARSAARATIVERQR